jgi:hypothetical protein
MAENKDLFEMKKSTGMKNQTLILYFLFYNSLQTTLSDNIKLLILLKLHYLIISVFVASRLNRTIHQRTKKNNTKLII